MTKRRHILWCLIATLSAACGPSGAADDLDEARALWRAADIPTYSFTLKENCFCPEDALRPVRHVVTGTSAEATYADDAGGAAPGRTMEAIFDQMDRFVDAAEATVQYDANYGFPTTADFDNPSVNDDWWRFEIMDFEAQVETD